MMISILPEIGFESVILSGYGTDQFRKITGNNIDGNGIRSESNKRLSEFLPPVHVDQPVRKGQRSHREAAGKQYKGGCPQGLVHREKTIPDQSAGYKQGGNRKKPGDFI